MSQLATVIGRKGGICWTSPLGVQVPCCRVRHLAQGAGPCHRWREAVDPVCAAEETAQDEGNDQEVHGDWSRGMMHIILDLIEGDAPRGGNGDGSGNGITQLDKLGLQLIKAPKQCKWLDVTVIRLDAVLLVRDNDGRLLPSSRDGGLWTV
jgi:hypothetical protein